jgi:hypothetical protein
MEKLLNKLRDKLRTSFINIGDIESKKNLTKYEDSLFLSITNCGLNWQKKKIESLFENGSVSELEIDSDEMKLVKENGWISECLKPSKKGHYFINLNGLYSIEKKKKSNLKTNLIDILQNNFYQGINWTLKDEEKLIISLLIIFNAFDKESSFSFTKESEEVIWEFMKTKLAKGLEEIGVCNSFIKKIDDKSTKYASAQNFISGHPNVLSRTGFFIPNNGKYHLALKEANDEFFLVNLLFSELGYFEKVKYVELIELLGRELFMKSILKDKFYFNESLRKKILQ